MAQYVKIGLVSEALIADVAIDWRSRSLDMLRDEAVRKGYHPTPGGTVEEIELASWSAALDPRPEGVRLFRYAIPLSDPDEVVPPTMMLFD